MAGVFSSLVTRKSSKHTSKTNLSQDLLDLSRLSKIVALQKCFCFFSEFIPYCGFAAILQRLLEFRWVQGRPRPLRMSGPCGTPSSPCRYGHKCKLSTPPFLDLASKICLKGKSMTPHLGIILLPFISSCNSHVSVLDPSWTF